VPDFPFELVVNIESWPSEARRPRKALRMDVGVEKRNIHDWKVYPPDEEPIASSSEPASDVKLVLERNFEFQLPLQWLLAIPVASSAHAVRKISSAAATRLRLRFSLWQDHLPVDALPLEGWIELQLLSEHDLAALAYS
jgi:hypothetical protein